MAVVLEAITAASLDATIPTLLSAGVRAVYKSMVEDSIVSIFKWMVL